MAASDQIPLEFQVPKDDPSGLMLQNLFGSGWDQIGEDSGTVYSAATMIYDVLSTFNIVALAVVSVLFAITFTSGAIGTANEGTPMGKRFSATWMPLRFALSISALAPIFKGLSLFQAFMLLLVGFSINLSNFFWNRGVDFFAESAVTLTMQAPDSLLLDSQNLAGGILRSLVLQEYLVKRLGVTLDDNLTYRTSAVQASDSKDQPRTDGNVYYTFVVGAGLNEGALGRIKIPCSNLNDNICSTRQTAVAGLITNLQPLASAIADLDAILPEAQTSTLSRHVQAYQQDIAPTLDMAKQQALSGLSQQLKGFSDTSKNAGWVLAGSYYWNVSQLNEKAQHAVYVQVAHSAADVDKIAAKSLEDINAVLSRVDAYIDSAYSLERTSNTGGSVTDDESGDSFGIMQKIRDKFNLVAQSVMAVFVDNFDQRQISDSTVGKTVGGGRPDPIAVMAACGNTLMSASDAFIAMDVALAGDLAAARSADQGGAGQKASWAPGLGDKSEAVRGGLAGAGFKALEYIKTIVYILAPAGFYLAYFLPAIPLIIWLAGVFGWLIMVLESLAAAPLWVAAHALPEGEGWTGNAGGHGYILFLGVVMRPPLMIFGFLVGMCLMSGLGIVLGAIFSGFVYEFLRESFVGIAAALSYVLIMGTIITIATVKFFGLITHLPDRVTNWIGRQLTSFSESHEAKRVAEKTTPAAARGGQNVAPVQPQQVATTVYAATATTAVVAQAETLNGGVTPQAGGVVGGGGVVAGGGGMVSGIGGGSGGSVGGGSNIQVRPSTDPTQF